MSELVRVTPVATEVAERDPLREFDLARDAWLEAQKSEKTVATYRIHINQWRDWAVENGVDPLRPRRVDADRWANHMRHTMGLGVSAVNGKLAAAASLMTHVIDQGVPLTNPFKDVKRVKINQNLQKTPALSDDEAARLMEVAERDGQRSKVIVGLALTLGVRVSELAGIDADDFTTEASRALVLVTRKGGQQECIVVPAPVIQDVRALLAGRTTGPLLTTKTGQRMDRYAIRRIVLRLARTAGVENADRIGPHALRRTVATSDLERGTPPHLVQQKLGHARLDTTLLYLRARNLMRDMDALNTATAAIVYARIQEKS